jgi:DNA primase
MLLGHELLEEISRRTDLVQLIGRRVKLQRKGRVFWGLCPFHKEKSPSFKVDNERRNYHCFGCGAGGDLFKWVTETEGLKFPEAVERLASEAGVALPVAGPADRANEARRKSLFEVIAIASGFYRDQLCGPTGVPARRYLETRGLSPAVWDRFGLGYAPKNSGLQAWLRSKGVDLAAMLEAGLVRPAEDDRPPRDFFFDRLMFPIADIRGRVVAFGGRGLTSDAKPKYINTGETPLFSKGRMLYNLHSAREAVHKGAPMIVAEGYMDVIALMEAGFHGAVAPLGTALTEDQLALLWRSSAEPVLCFDGDDAGLRAARRASHLALPHLTPGQSLRFVFLPKGEDPDSLIRGQGAGTFRELLAKAQPLAEVIWAGETEGRDFSTPERRAGLEAELGRLNQSMRDQKVAEYYRREFADRLFKTFRQFKKSANPRWRGGQRPDRRSDSSAGMFAEQVSPAVKRSILAASSPAAAKNLNERRLLGFLISAPDFLERNIEALAWLTFSDPQLDRVRSEILNLAASHERLDTAAVQNHLVCQGLGVVAERLKADWVVIASLKEHSDASGREELFVRLRAQLENADSTALGQLQERRDRVLTHYLEHGAGNDWDELQRLNNEIRAHLERTGNGI